MTLVMSPLFLNLLSSGTRSRSRALLYNHRTNEKRIHLSTGKLVIVHGDRSPFDLIRPPYDDAILMSFCCGTRESISGRAGMRRSQRRGVSFEFRSSIVSLDRRTCSVCQLLVNRAFRDFDHDPHSVFHAIGELRISTRRSG